MTPYPWSCLACGRSQPADATRCDVCGCTASATRAQVDAARGASNAPAGESAAAPAFVAWLAGLPLLPIAGGLLAVLVWMFGSGVTAVAFGALWVSLAALCASAYRPTR